MPRRAVVTAYALLLLIAVVAYREVEWWPLTSWKLFSFVRTGTLAEWEIVTVSGESEAVIPFRALPRGYRTFHRVVGHVHRGSQDERRAACAAWAGAARRLGRDVDAVRAYRLRVQVAKPGRPRAITSRVLAFECRPT